jgi:hypothetical protein
MAFNATAVQRELIEQYGGRYEKYLQKQNDTLF